MKRFLLLIALSTTVTLVSQNTSRILEMAKLKDKNSLTVQVSDGTYTFIFYDANIVENTFIPLRQNPSSISHAVILTPKKVAVNLKETKNQIVFGSSVLKVHIQKKPFKITYVHNNKEVVSEKRGYLAQNGKEILEFNIDKQEVLYGGGARALGMNRRGNRLELYNKAHYGYETHSELMNYTMPIVISSKKYLLHFDNAPIGFLDLDSKQNNTLSYETISGRKTYQIIVQDNWLDLLDSYTDLTGKQPMIPRWALGNFASRFGYHSQKEVTEVVAAYEKNNIPLDAIILDLYWFGKEIKGTMGNFEVFKDSFPDFEGMVSTLSEKGIKTIPITEPFILRTSKKWKEAVSKNILAKDSIGNPAQYDFYFGNTGLIDIYRKQGKEWFWSQYQKLNNMGVAGVWGDLGEPEVHPSWVQHGSRSADEVHNIYGHDWARLVYEGYTKNYPMIRPFILMRAGYSGSQRFGMIPWSGDVNRTWGGLQSQPEIALQMGMQGLGYMHSDLGGFAGANLDDALYVRWLQYGVFQPIFRPHGQEEVPSEPVFRSEKAMQLAKEAIQLRYKLLPYNYHLVYENHTKGTPLMRPLFFYYPDNTAATIATTYLWGNDFLIAPHLKKKSADNKLYIPEKTIWFDFYTDKKIIGKGWEKSLHHAKKTIPTLVRAGAFIPLSKVVEKENEYNPNDLSIHYYHDTSILDSKREIYNDDGKTANAFSANAYEIVQLKSTFDNSELSFSLAAIIGESYTAQEKNYEFILHNIEEKPNRVTHDGKQVAVIYDLANKTLKVPVQWSTDKSTTIKIQFTL